ncbi:hypothetical protein EVAR_46318_1 [Eumeta japonica]|uniref:Mutator-like transposase domain-containing protein n=1 Tax=Eumeta variegata TaxID=151549 RepID=A0A4C1WWK3_EUMVA|nr:hypothetical protein EVAR_46318_1 [Eumeta japonica]
MNKSGAKERQAALYEGRITEEGIPIIDVVADGYWSKKSYKTNYSALPGAAAIIGKGFGEVLFLGVCAAPSRVATSHITTTVPG